VFIGGPLGNDIQPNIARLVEEVHQILYNARSVAARQVNIVAVWTNFEIGRCIVLHEQLGDARAQYGRSVLVALSNELTSMFGRGYSVENLRLFRKFYLTYRARVEKSQTPSGISVRIPQTVSGKSLPDHLSGTWSPRHSTPSDTSFTLSWSHYVFLISVSDVDERQFYEIEATANGWSLAEMKRQFNSSLYERLALSRDQDGIRALALQGQVVGAPSDLLKDPYVLEFLGLEQQPQYSESDLESRIIDKLEHFLLELGKGFLFEGADPIVHRGYVHLKPPS